MLGVSLANQSLSVLICVIECFKHGPAVRASLLSHQSSLLLR